MVEYSQDQATSSDLASNYSDEGYSAVFKDPMESYNEMERSGVTVESSGKLSDVIKKQQAPNPKLLREKRLKILFLQYINKYLSNPKKFIDHPKQIRKLPSWFDDAIVLFKDNEISRYQKKMIREFFYGLIQYRDDQMVNERYGAVDTDEVNRQLGARSPYAEPQGNLDDKQFPREQELRNVDLKGLMRETRSIDTRKPTQDVPFEDYGGVDPYASPVVNYTTTKEKATFGGLSLGRVGPSNSTANSFINLNKKEQVLPGETQSNPTQRPVSANIQAKSGALQSRKNMGSTFLTGFIMGNSLAQKPVRPLEQPTIAPQVEVNRVKKTQLKARIKRSIQKKKSNPLVMEQKSSDTISKVLKGVNALGPKHLKPLRHTKLQPINTQKSVSGLSTIKNMDKLFGQVQSESTKNFGKDNMKMKVVTDIKDQCTRAFAKNKFRQESVNMKKNYFNDVKNSYPRMKLDMEDMGEIRENRMMQNSVNDVPRIISVGRTIKSATIRRGDMRPKAFGIAEYDFSIEPLGKKKPKKIEMFDEDDF